MKYLKSIDCLKGYATLMICGIHFNVYLNFKIFNYNSFLVVNFFFVISGFICFSNYFNRLHNFSLIKTFLQKRFLNLYPLHIITLFLFLLIEISKLVALTFFDIKPNYDPFIKNDLISFFANIFLLQNIIGNPLSFNGVSWYLCAQFFCYYIFIFSIFFLKRFILILIFLFLIFYYPVFLNHHNSYWGVHSLLNSLFCFFIGCLFGYIFYEKVFLLKKKYNILLLLFIFLLNFFFIKYKYYQITFLFISGFVLYLFTFLENETIFSKILFNNFIKFIGKISYSIYMLHSLILWVVINSIKLFLNIPFKDSKYSVIEEDRQYPEILISIEKKYLLLLFLYFLTIIVSYYSYKFIETKFKKN